MILRAEASNRGEDQPNCPVISKGRRAVEHAIGDGPTPQIALEQVINPPVEVVDLLAEGSSSHALTPE
jgi:hypothetical protein